MGTAQVTHDRLVAEAAFAKRPDASPPYDASCWALKSRYHDAPACAKKDRWPDWAWDVSLESALKGDCVMPDASPTRAARSFLEGRGVADPATRTLTVVFLGLSFAGRRPSPPR